MKYFDSNCYCFGVLLVCGDEQRKRFKKSYLTMLLRGIHCLDVVTPNNYLKTLIKRMKNGVTECGWYRKEDFLQETKKLTKNTLTTQFILLNFIPINLNGTLYITYNNLLKDYPEFMQIN